MDRDKEIIAKMPTKGFNSDNIAGASPEVFEAIVTSNARQANAMAQRLVTGLIQLSGVNVMGPTQSNIVFGHLPEAITAGLLKAGFHFYHDRWEPGVVRFATSFATTTDDIDHLQAYMQHLAVTSASQPRSSAGSTQ